MINWEEFTKEIKLLGEKIDFEPDCVVGIARGGVVPAVLLAGHLKVRDMHTIKVRNEGEERKIMADIFIDIANKNVLLVEDMLESGKSMVVVKEYLENMGAEVKTACLYIMPRTETKPEFYLKEVLEVQHFPWESR